MAGNFLSSFVKPRDASDQELKVKFLINIPVKVESVEQAEEKCTELLDALSEGFKTESKRYMNDKKDKKVDDAAVIFGLNGKYTPELEKVLKKLKGFKYRKKDTDIKYSVITYTWGRDGDIAEHVPEDKIPFQDIREYLKNHQETKELVKKLRGKDPKCLVYFSFVDSDTIKFNYIYSEYLEIVREELNKDSVPPTVMSTGYEFPESTDNGKEYKASWLDRRIRAQIADIHPLFVYYPEPNFCVLVREGCDTIEESFIQEGRKQDEYRMESPVLIRQVKRRDNFKAVFTLKNPIITEVPERFKVSANGRIINQSPMKGMNLAKSVMCNKVMTNAETYTKGEGPNNHKLVQGVAGKNRGFITDLFNCKDDNTFEELSKKNPFNIEGKVATILIDAVREARKFKKFDLENQQSVTDSEEVLQDEGLGQLGDLDLSQLRLAPASP